MRRISIMSEGSMSACAELRSSVQRFRVHSGNGSGHHDKSFAFFVQAWVMALAFAAQTLALTIDGQAATS